jgi:hypothetical protein
LHYEVAAELRTPLEAEIQRHLSEWHDGALQSYEDCHRYLTQQLASLDRSARGEAVFHIIADWVVLAVTGGKDIDCRQPIRELLGERYEIETEGFWKC